MISCSSCNVSVINGVICHETGCHEAYRDETRECRWCGKMFKPEDKDQAYCSSDCYCSDNDCYDEYCPECGCLWEVHNDDGSCVDEE